MAEATASVSTTKTETIEHSKSPVLKLRLQKPKSNKKVDWTTDTVDNEHMGKKSSKCCCIYEKPHGFGESSSEDDDDECGHCRGHKKKCHKNPVTDGDASQQPESNPGIVQES
ncbi:PREDICTED: protein phosphatase 1 regulatory subunit 11-like [Priapulus caudatus]|uniref:E3 ubiquitin-protein ligase PPP1R11 n=1 Tax=Priapulus caudatus TaxID=37621 RepID=A0ABM1EG00_PRICU|nr:PREDICTED: protein phosphatase 1 regulatory subunit 11-like [Priapulus caudatus]